MTALVLVVEGPDDKRTAQALAQKILGCEPQWVVKTWIQVAQERKSLGRRLHGHFAGKPGDPDAYNARAALMLVRHHPRAPQAVILLRDADQQIERRDGLNQAREEHRSRYNSRLPVAIGLAIPKREAWILAGFIPRDLQERSDLQSETARLGFNPALQPEKLSASTHSSKTDIKVVVRNLGIDADREEACLADLAVLRKNGSQTGLPAFLNEIQEHLHPLFHQQSPI